MSEPDALLPEPRGRRPILTPDVQERIVQAVSAGNYLDDAAAYAGIHRATVFDWLAKGREALEAEEAGEEITERQRLYADFADAVETARARAVVRNLTIIQRAAEESWQAAAWYLERTNPKKWGRHETVALTGGDGGPVRVEHSARETLAAKFAAAEEAARQAAIEAEGREIEEPEPGAPRLKRAT